MDTVISRLFLKAAAAMAAWLVAGGIATTAWAAPDPAGALLALSEIKQEELPAGEAGDTETEAPPSPSDGVPMPDPVLRLPLPSSPQAGPRPDDLVPADDAAPEDEMAGPAEPAPEVIYDLERLPEEVRRMRGLLMDAARTGDLERLRPLIGLGEATTQLSFGGKVDDPIAFLRDVSGDEGGQEILAILLEVLESGYVHLEPGTPNEIYVWPYFFAVPIETLSPPRRVELFELVTAGDYEEMKLYGAYNFYRVGIAPDGRWLFFVAGD